MSGSHYDGDPALRYFPEDTMPDLPPVTVRPGRGGAGVLSVENLRAAGYRVVVQVAPPPGPEEHDLRTYAERTDARLAEIRRMVEDLVAVTARLGDHVITLALRLNQLEGRDG